ncbi:MAG: hypothetical protein AB7O98_16535 [Hyphomonadaceae bacterium]
MAFVLGVCLFGSALAGNDEDSCPRPRASSPVAVDEGGAVVNEDTTCARFNRWIASSVSVPSEPGGHVFTVRTLMAPQESGLADRLEAVEVFFDGRRLTRLYADELHQIGTPVLSRMRVVTFGGDVRSIEIRMPVVSRCDHAIDELRGSASYYPLEVDDPGGMDIYYNGYAIIDVQVPLRGRRVAHTVSVYRCDEGILERQR